MTSPAIQDEKTHYYSQQDLERLDRSAIPHHVAVVMDGNRRWAEREGVPAAFGHWQGAQVVVKIVNAALELGIKVLTVYAFSTENWRRSKEEVESLMQLFTLFLEQQREMMQQNGVRLLTIGEMSQLPIELQEEIVQSKEATKECKKIALVLAINYGGRDDIRRAFVHMLRDSKLGVLNEEQVTEEMISQYLDTAHLPDPDLFIRTSGEQRLSNFLLWQLSYSELYHTDVYWPDFDQFELLRAIQSYQVRKRRLGGT